MSMRRFENKVVVIAGGGTGLGAGTAMRLASEGAKVVIGDLSADLANGVADKIKATGGDARGLAFDMAEENSIAALIQTAVDSFGGLDGIHINAADMKTLRLDSDILAIDMAIFDRTIQINLRGHVLCTRHA